MDAQEQKEGSNDETGLSSGESEDSTDDGNASSRRGGRGNFSVGVQRAPKYSDAEKRMLVETYGKYFGKNILPDNLMFRIRRRFNKWLRAQGIRHNGAPLKRTRAGLRQHEQKLFAEGWKWNGGVVPAAPRQKRKSARNQKKLSPSPPADPAVRANEEWEGEDELRRQSLKMKHDDAPLDLAAEFAEADAALETVEASDEDDFMMTGGLGAPVAQLQTRAHSPRVSGQPAQPTPAQPSTAAVPNQAQHTAPRPRRAAPMRPANLGRELAPSNNLVRELAAALDDAERMHDQLFGPHRPGCGCKKPFRG